MCVCVCVCVCMCSGKISRHKARHMIFFPVVLSVSCLLTYSVVSNSKEWQKLKDSHQISTGTYSDLIISTQVCMCDDVIILT